MVDSVGGQTAIDCIKRYGLDVNFFFKKIFMENIGFYSYSHFSLSWEGRFVVVGFASGDIPKVRFN